MKKNLLVIEIKKALFTRSFFIPLILMCAIACLSASYIIEIFFDNTHMYESISQNGIFEKNYIFQTLSSYSGWIGNESRSLMQSVFFILIPVVAAIPFSTSFFTERKIGYHRNIATRINISFYYLAKSLACFISGFLVVTLPLTVNFLLVSAFLPSSLPHINYDIYYLVYYGELFSDIFYSQPLLFVALFILLNGLFSGTIALLVFALSLKINNKYVSLFLPLLMFLGIDYIANFVLRNVDGNVWGIEFSLINLLHANSSRGTKLWWMLACQFLILFGSAVSFLYLRSKKDEIF